MIFIYLGGGRSQLWLTLLGLVATVVFNSGLLSSPASSPSRASSVEWPVTTGAWEPRVTSSMWLTLLVPVFALLAFIGCKAYFSIRRQGLHNSLRELSQFMRNWGGAVQGQQAPVSSAVSKRRRFEAVSKVVQQLPLEVYAAKADLQQLPLSDLKRRLRLARVNSKASLDKTEAIDQILAAGNSSSSSCTVCCDDYESGDALRVLTCGHKYHVECIDKWLLSSIDYLRTPACPICNAVLLEERC